MTDHEPHPRGELADALRHGVAGHMEDVAVRLMLCLRHELWAGAAMNRYIIWWDKTGRQAARMRWDELAKRINRDTSPLSVDIDERRIIAVACSLGGGAPVSLNDALAGRTYVARLILARAMRDALHLPEVDR